MIHTNETNLESLKKAVASAKKRIFLISPWIRSETFKKIFTDEIIAKINKKNIKVNIVIRLSSMDDLKFTDENFFAIIDSNKSNFFLRYNKNLHSKIYIIDDSYALVGSFNLTGGGFGDKEEKGTNIETGYEIKNKAEIKALIKVAQDIWENSLDIPDDLLGFTLNETTHHSFIIAGIRPLESGKFVEIRERNNEIILGQIGEVRKYNFSFYNSPSPEEYSDEIINIFSNNSELTNKIKGLISSISLEEGQLNIGSVSIIGRFFIGKDIIKEDNKIAPDVGKEVFIASKPVLEKLFSNKYCSPAVLYSNRDVKAGLNPDEIITKHMAVFGTTGSGKSYFVKKMLEDYLYDYFVKQQKARIIIFDPHGEYAKDLKKFLSKKNIIDSNECEKREYLTYHICSSDDFIEYFGIRKNSKLAESISTIFNYNEVSNKNIVNLLKEVKIDENFLSYLKELIKDKEISFEEPKEIWKDFKTPDIYCINFEDVSDIDEMRIIAGNIISGIFNYSKSNKNFPTLFVIEEAHNFAPEGEGKNNICAVAIRQVAREGRKFKNGIVVITQRPAYVSKDVLTQCSTQAIFRLINSNDISQIADVVEGISKQELIRLPHYVQGQCIFTGVGIESPVVVKIQ